MTLSAADFSLQSRANAQEPRHYVERKKPAARTFTASAGSNVLRNALDLARKDPLQFQKWVVESLCDGFCTRKKSHDKGIDGRLYFGKEGDMRSMVISVKGGAHVTPAFVRELYGTLQGDLGSEIAGLVITRVPTKGMVAATLQGEYYKYMGREYPRIQIRTIEELFAGKHFDLPPYLGFTKGKAQGEILNA